MNSSNVIVNIKNKDDLLNITDNTKYINISIDNVNFDVIDYFLLNGNKYSYSDIICEKNGFIYASYDMFKMGENLITNIIDCMPTDLTDIEKIRYVYISLGKILCVDINTLNNKNETVSFDKISTINNIWGALSCRRVGDVVTSKIFMYVCSRIGIKCELISSNMKGDIACKVYVDDTFLVVDLFSDIYNIQGGFITKYFDKYNDNREIDKKIGYIDDDYVDYCIENTLKSIDDSNDNLLLLLNKTCSIINVNNIGSYELFNIYKDIFNKYIPNYGVKVNNLFVYNSFCMKEHFILFNYKNNYIVIIIIKDVLLILIMMIF